ncbi:MAG TPA: S-adenosylmethionine:tRNA ribosyltransferase-isomerase, partial [Burkholderiales bacterium]|nr:S-adenosylmethionine:tRNA ribosyltransferase-isomerase [Burkholderiales bacterium]
MSAPENKPTAASAVHSRERYSVPLPLRVSDFDYDLPGELIAQHPLPRRDDSRMMVVEKATGRVGHHLFKAFPSFFKKGDLVVLNDTRVIPARAWGERSGARIEFLFVRELGPGLWETLCRPARKLVRGDEVDFGPGFEAFVEDVREEGQRVLRFARPDVRA